MLTRDATLRKSTLQLESARKVSPVAGRTSVSDNFHAIILALLDSRKGFPLIVRFFFFSFTG